MYLAAHLGYASPTRMLDEMSGLDLALWEQYMVLHPFGDVREDARHGIRSALFVTANSKKGAQIKPGDFTPKFSNQKKSGEPMSVEQQLNLAVMLNAYFGGADNRPEATAA